MPGLLDTADRADEADAEDAGWEPRLTAADFDRHEAEYYAALTDEDFMQSQTEHRQRTITEAAFEVVGLSRPDIHCYGDLLLQYETAPDARGNRYGRVTPDNFVVVAPVRPGHNRSYNIPPNPRPLMAFEYLSHSTRAKDYGPSLDKYQRILRVLYYLIYDPQEPADPNAPDDPLRQPTAELRRLTPDGYVLVAPDAQGRWAIPELELEVGMVGFWLRFWFRGVLLNLPAESELMRLAAERRAEDEKIRADEERRRADDEKIRADDERRRADDEKRRADDERRRADEAEAELVRLRALLSAKPE